MGVWGVKGSRVSGHMGWLSLFRAMWILTSSRVVSGVPDVDYGGQGGLGDVALHPDYPDNGMIYLSYAEGGVGGLVPVDASLRQLAGLDDGDVIEVWCK